VVAVDQRDVEIRDPAEDVEAAGTVEAQSLAVLQLPAGNVDSRCRIDRVDRGVVLARPGEKPRGRETPFAANLDDRPRVGGVEERADDRSPERVHQAAATSS
jgi:hypothetical protein